MIHWRVGVIFLIYSSLFLSNSSFADKSNKAFRSFWHPTFLGERLDYCTLDGKECGKAVADRFCQMLGYHYSTQNKIAYNLGLTHFLSTRMACKGWRCNGFVTITCETNLSHNPPKPYHYREKQFAFPRYNNYRIDWCYTRHQGCGKRAADSFCSRMGFMQAKQFLAERFVQATKTIGSQELCFGQHCEAFKRIVCVR